MGIEIVDSYVEKTPGIETYILDRAFSNMSITAGCFYKINKESIRQPFEYDVSRLQELLKEIYALPSDVDLKGIVHHIVTVINKHNLEETEYMYFVDIIQSILTTIVNEYLQYSFKLDGNIDDLLLDVEDLTHHFADDKYKTYFNYITNSIADICNTNLKLLDNVLEAFVNSRTVVDGIYHYDFIIYIPQPVCGVIVNKDINIFTLNSKLTMINNYSYVVKDSDAELMNFCKALKENDIFKKYGYINLISPRHRFNFINHRFHLFDSVDGYLIVK